MRGSNREEITDQIRGILPMGGVFTTIGKTGIKISEEELLNMLGEPDNRTSHHVYTVYEYSLLPQDAVTPAGRNIRKTLKIVILDGYVVCTGIFVH